MEQAKDTGSIAPATIAEWRDAIGRTATETQKLDPVALQRFARAIGQRGDGEAVPLPHWAFFLPCPHDAAIGADGHPKRGDFLPDITLPRRMFAAASMEFGAPLKLSHEATLTSTVADVRHKSGRSGELVFVEVDRVVEQHGTVCVNERQTYVYRNAGEPIPLPPLATSQPEGELWQPDEANLFRFSAATFNGHRIHYDHPYATEIEGYPALVVHGPFSAVRLAALAMRDGPIATFTFRAMAPLFLGQPIALRKTSETQLEAIRCDGMTAMSATVSYA